MDNLSRHFSRHEFACKCGCGQDTIDAALIATLEMVRMHFDRPIGINSGNRCKAYNATLPNASPNSQHLLGRAADFVVAGVMPDRVFGFLRDDHPGGLGAYRTFTHIDSRSNRARWDFSKR